MGKRRSKKGRSAKNAQKSLTSQEPEHLVKAPHSFIINRGRLGKYANDLMMNFRKLMAPFTASHLKVQKRNVIKDFIHIAGPLNVTHLVVFTKSEIAMYLRIARLPRGPTLTFKIHEYTLSKDVVSSLKKALTYQQLFEHHPLLVLNNFSGEGLHFKLMISMFQGMFPSINVHKANLNTIRRCLLINYNSDDKTIDLRHYAVKIVPCGMSKSVKKLVQSKVPDLGQYHDVSEFLMQPGNLSESEVEFEGPTNQVILPQPISGRGNITSQKSAIRMCELGPRLKLQLVKIEEGLMTGEVMFHEFIKKTPEEVKAIKAARNRKKMLKEQRKAIQDENVRRKKLANVPQKQSNGVSQDSVEEGIESDVEDNDNEWYKKEVGENPDEDVLPKRKQKSVSFSEEKPSKKRKIAQEDRVSNKSSEKKKKSPGTYQESLALLKKRKEHKLKKKLARQKSLKALSTKPKMKTKRAQKKR